jgi:hypothetical protein
MKNKNNSQTIKLNNENRAGDPRGESLWMQLAGRELVGGGGSVLAIEEVTPWPEPVEGAALLDELAGTLRRFIILPKWGAETLALWTLHTYAFRLRDVSTYIGIESPEKRCGKTTLLTVLSEMVNRAVVSSNISSPAFFRVIEEIRPTLLIDEADTFLQGNDELRGILNSGYSRKTAFVVRVTNELSPTWRAAAPRDRAADGASGEDSASSADSKPSTRLARFSAWCPKAIAAIGRLPETLADRCIVIRMERKSSKEECERLRNLEATALRQRCLRFVTDRATQIASARPELPESLNDRAADIWEPLLALADLAGGNWPTLARQAAESLTASGQDSNPTGTLLLDIFFAIAASGGGRIHSRTLAEALTARMGARPWGEMVRGREVTELWLAQKLRPYGIRPRNLHVDGVQAKGYVFDELVEVCRRYVPRSEIDALKAEVQGMKAEGEVETATLKQ